MMKKRIRLLSMILSLSLGLSGCSNTNIREDKLVPINTLEADSSIENDLQKEQKRDVNLLERTEVVNPGAVQSYLDYFDNITYNYNGEEFYLSDEELNKLIETGNTISKVEHNSISTDAYLTFEKIRINSEKLAGEREDLHSCFLGNKVGEDLEFPVFFEATLYHILSQYCQNETNDIKEDFCKFQNLSICYGDLNKILEYQDEEVGLLGYYDDEDNVIVLDIKGIYELYNSLSSWYLYDNQSYANLYDVIMETLVHELNHVRQHSCDCRIKAGQEYSSIGDYSEYVPTIIESSAESSIYNTQDYLSKYIKGSNTQDFTYPQEREYECFIILLGLLYNDIDDYYNAIYDSDLNRLYEFAGCKDENDIERLYHILYNIDGLMLRNDLVFNIGGDEVITYDVERLVGNEFSYEVLNIFTEELIRYLRNHDDMSDLDAIVLFMMAENLSLSHTTYMISDEDGYVQTEYDKALINNINQTRIHFENFIMEYYGLTDNELYLATLKAYFILKANEDMEEGNEKYRDKLESLMDRFPLMKVIYDGSENNPMTYQYVYTINDIDYKVH